MSEQEQLTTQEKRILGISVGFVLALMVAGALWLFWPPREVQVVATTLRATPTPTPEHGPHVSILTAHFFSGYDPQGEDRLSEFARAAQDGKCYIAPACISVKERDGRYTFDFAPCPAEYGNFVEVECLQEVKHD